MSSEIVSQTEMLVESDVNATPWSNAPTVSLIVVSSGPCAELRRVLAQFAENGKPCAEILVVRPEPMPADMPALLARAGARYIEAGADQSLAELRQLGASQASGQVVVIREDRAVVDASLFNRFGCRANVERQVPVRTAVERAAPARPASARVPRASRIVPGQAPA